MLVSKQFHRAVRGLTLSYESLMQVFLNEFLKWCEGNGMTISPDVWQQIDASLASLKTDEPATAVKELNRAITEHVIPKISHFKKWGSSQSPTFKYWVLFLDAAQILLRNIRAE